MWGDGKDSSASGSKGGCVENSWLEIRPSNLDGADPAGPGARQSTSTWGQSLLADSSACSQLEAEGWEHNRVALPYESKRFDLTTGYEHQIGL